MLLKDALKGMEAQSLDCARGVADYYTNNQVRFRDYIHGAGTFPSTISFIGQPRGLVANWQLAFAMMGQLAAARAFACDLYEYSAFKLISYLRSLQIFDPFRPEHSGAIREMTALTPWCYVRDALSGAWGFLEYYRATGEEEYLDRARRWFAWYEKHGCDPDGLPLWGAEFGEPISNGTPHMYNDLLGDFSGGCFCFFTQLARELDDPALLRGKIMRFADFYLTRVQQPGGFFRTVRKSDGSAPEEDPQNGLHKSNDDFSSLGMLSLYRVTGDPRYLAAVKKFLSAVFAIQRPDGSFEESVAGIPVVLNTLLEAEPDLGELPEAWLEGAQKALAKLLSRQAKGDIIPAQRGGIDEYGNQETGARASAYTLIVLLKLFAGETRFLSVRNLERIAAWA